MYKFIDSMHQEYRDYYGYIYLTLDQKYNKVYIGQKKGRILDSPEYFGSGKIIYRMIKKRELFFLKKFILGVCYCKEDLDEAEIECISFFNSTNFLYGYNLTGGGSGGSSVICLPETRRKMSISRKGKKRPPSHCQHMQKIYKCPYCGKEGKTVVMKRYHFENCIENPINVNRNFKEERTPKNKGVSPTQETIEKQKLSFKNGTLLVCPWCSIEGRGGWMYQIHFENCEKNPSNKNRDLKSERKKSEKSKQKMSEWAKNQKKYLCPHCNKYFIASHLSRYHMDKCKCR